jgi:hypothetical protein
VIESWNSALLSLLRQMGFCNSTSSVDRYLADELLQETINKSLNNEFVFVQGKCSGTAANYAALTMASRFDTIWTMFAISSYVGSDGCHFQDMARSKLDGRHRLCCITEPMAAEDKWAVI